MLATLTIDAELLQTAIDLDTQNTKDTSVEAALCEYIQHRQQLKQAVMIGAIAADRGDVIDGESAIVTSTHSKKSRSYRLRLNHGVSDNWFFKVWSSTIWAAPLSISIVLIYDSPTPLPLHQPTQH